MSALFFEARVLALSARFRTHESWIDVWNLNSCCLAGAAQGLVLESCGEGKSPKVVKGGCRRSFGPKGRVQKVLWTQGAKVSKESLHRPNLFCTSATPFRTGATGSLLVGSKDLLRPLPTTCAFWETSPFGQFARRVASQPWFFATSVAPSLATLWCYHCDSPYPPYLVSELSTTPTRCDTPLQHFDVRRRHICAIPHSATYRAIPVRYPMHKKLGRHVCRTKLPRKTFKSIRKTVWKTRKKIKETIRNVFEIFLAPLRPLKNVSPALFTKF